MSKDVFDTNIYIKYDISLTNKQFFSAVVLQELTVGALDNNELKEWEAVRRQLEKDDLLIIPNGEDWFEAGKILNYLMRGIKSKGKAKKISFDEAQRIIRDVLIARTVKRENARLVTDNIKDFETIKRFCNIKLISGADYFEQ